MTGDDGAASSVAVPSSAPERSARSRLLLGGGVGLAVLVVDQSTKTLAEDRLTSSHHLLATLWLRLDYNTGAAFSLGRGVSPVVTAVVVVIVVCLLLFGRFASRTATRRCQVGLGLLVGGAIGNLVDRVFRHNSGAVIDFIDALRIGRTSRWPIFNVADMGIVIGSAIVVLSYAGTHHPPASDPPPLDAKVPDPHVPDAGASDSPGGVPGPR